MTQREKAAAFDRMVETARAGAEVQLALANRVDPRFAHEYAFRSNCFVDVLQAAGLASCICETCREFRHRRKAGAA